MKHNNEAMPARVAGKRRAFILYSVIAVTIFVFISALALTVFAEEFPAGFRLALLLPQQSRPASDNFVATTTRHTWRITKGIRSPDGVEKSVYLINGRPDTFFP